MHHASLHFDPYDYVVYAHSYLQTTAFSTYVKTEAFNLGVEREIQ